MPFLTTLPLPQPKLPTDSQPDRLFKPGRHALLLAVLAIAVVLILWLRALTAEQRAINNMDPQARAALFQETWLSVQGLCRPQTDSALLARCREQAQFLLKFPECGEPCRQFLEPYAYPGR